MTRPLRARALAAAGVAVAIAALRVLGCSSSGCDFSGYCCCAGSVRGTPLCGTYGPFCVNGLSLHKDDCDQQCVGSPDAAPDAPDAPADAPIDAPADAATCNTGDACCCAGDVLDYPMCVDGGQVSCRAGYGLYHGDDCRCLPDRNTPCCLPHPLADAATDG